jgi:hypothetical protein
MIERIFRRGLREQPFVFAELETHRGSLLASRMRDPRMV